MTDGDIGTWVGAVGTWLGALATGALVIAAIRGFSRAVQRSIPLSREGESTAQQLGKLRKPTRVGGFRRGKISESMPGNLTHLIHRTSRPHSYYG